MREFGLQTAVIFAHQREVKAVRKRSWRRGGRRHLAVQKIRSKYKENKKKPLLGTSLGGSPYATTASKSVIRPVFCAKSRTVFKFFAQRRIFADSSTLWTHWVEKVLYCRGIRDPRDVLLRRPRVKPFKAWSR